MAEHVRRLSGPRVPMLDSFLDMSMDQRWVDRSPREMFETFHSFAGEGFELILEDVERLVGDGRVLVEGFRLLSGVAPLLASPRRGVAAPNTGVPRARVQGAPLHARHRRPDE